MEFLEIQQGDGTIEVDVSGRKLSCTVCGHTRFHERTSMLNTRLATFFNLDWANKRATNYICAQCGYIFWFLPE